MDLGALIEAILFYKNEPIKIVALAKLIDRKEDEIEQAVTELKDRLSNRGIRLVTNNGVVSLATAPEASELIEAMRKEELSKDLGKAGLETLSIILYKGPISKREIDYIRGVNSSYIIRNLLVRGLVEKESGTGERSYIYKPTTELLQYLGISDISELPEYGDINESIDEFQRETAESEE